MYTSSDAFCLVIFQGKTNTQMSLSRKRLPDSGPARLNCSLRVAIFVLRARCHVTLFIEGAVTAKHLFKVIKSVFFLSLKTQLSLGNNAASRMKRNNPTEQS